MREGDGLALSSRNTYLDADERGQALVLNHAIRRVEELVASGELRSEALIAAAHAVFAEETAVRVDYIECVNWETLLPAEIAASGTLFAVAAWIGSTRLIDNTILN